MACAKSDIFEEVRSAAFQLAPSLEVDTATVNEGLGILHTVFGEEWLRNASKPRRVDPLPVARHPIGHCLSTAGKEQVIKLLEVAHYLKFFADSDAFETVVRGLREHFASTILQLSFGFRCARAGGENVRLEPPAAEGKKADVAFQFGKRSYLVECTIPRRERTGEPYNEIVRTAFSSLEYVDENHPITSVSIRFLEKPTARLRKAAIGIVRDLADEFYSCGDRLPGEAEFRETDSVVVSIGRSEKVPEGHDSKLAVHPAFPDPDSQPALFQRSKLVSQDVLVEAVPDITGPTGSHVAIWLPPEIEAKRSLERDLEDPLARLGKKIERKLGQTRREGEWGRIVVAQTWITDQMRRADDDTVARLRDRLFRQHSDVAGVLLLSRRWSRDRDRFVYSNYSLLPNCEDALPQGFLKSLRRSEERQSVPPMVADLRSSSPGESG